MATVRLSKSVWDATRRHLFDRVGEHFAFFLATWTYSRGKPVFLVQDAILIPDIEVEYRSTGFELSLTSILGAINRAQKEGACLIEVHNHSGMRPRFSTTDRSNLPEFVDYAISSLANRPYAATVWGDTRVYGEYFLPDGRTGVIESVTVIGSDLRQVVSLDDDGLQGSNDLRFVRQMPWFTASGQQQIRRLRIGLVGCGGAGSAVIQNLVYLGCRDFILIDPDHAEISNMNRLVTADFADIDTAKVTLGRQLIRSVAPEARVKVMRLKVRASEALDALKGVDVIFGCVDNDAARLILNEMALAYRIPFFDLAVGIDAASGRVNVAGGRVAVVLPGGPCLYCMDLLDVQEAAHFLLPDHERARNLEMGYVTGVDIEAPAVVSLNSQIAATAVNELAVLISGIREVNPFTEIDLLGSGRKDKAQWMSPVSSDREPDCIQCEQAGRGDQARIEARYAVEMPELEHAG